MKQSKQAEQMIEFMEMIDQIDISERDYMSNMAGKTDLPQDTPASKASGGGPGTVNRSTPNDYTRDEVSMMLDYASKFVKDAKQMESWKYSKEFLNTVGAAMSEFMTLRRGDPGLEYQDAEMQGDQHAQPYSKISQKNAAKGSASAELKGKAQGDTTNRSKEFETDISKKGSQDISFGKADKGKMTPGYLK
jgi:hypothetical protein